jgi:hypothetical protein
VHAVGKKPCEKHRKTRSFHCEKERKPCTCFNRTISPVTLVISPFPFRGKGEISQNFELKSYEPTRTSTTTFKLVEKTTVTWGVLYRLKVRTKAAAMKTSFVWILLLTALRGAQLSTNFPVR